MSSKRFVFLLLSCVWDGGFLSAALLEMEKEDFKVEEEIIPCLQHEDIITQILIRVVPPESLYVNLRYICKPWFNIITSPIFQHNHPISNEPPCLIIQNHKYTAYEHTKCVPEDQANILIDQAKRLGYVHTTRCNPVGEEGILRLELTSVFMTRRSAEPHNTYSIQVGEEGILQQVDLTSVFKTLRSAEPHTTCSIQVGEEGILQQVDLTWDFKKLHIRACCNGLMIVRPHGSPSDTLYIVNVITKQSVKLPPPPYVVNLPFCDYPIVGFTFVPSTGEYKVVLLRDRAKEGGSMKRKMMKSLYIQILTFGGTGGSSSYDDLHWRVVQAPQWHITTVPIAVHGVLYWSQSYYNRIITCFDAREERFYTFNCPGDDLSVPLLNEGLLEMAGYLACWIYSHDHQQLDFWILKNFRTGGDWTKYSSMCIGDQGIASHIDETYIQPILSYGSNGEVIIFEDSLEGNLLAYNMRSSIWWKMGNNVKLVGRMGDAISFSGFHVNKILPLDFLLEKRQPV